MSDPTVQSKEEILLEIRRKQGNKRKALDELTMTVANITIPPFVSREPAPVMIDKIITVIDHNELDGMNAESLITRLTDYSQTHKIPLHKFRFKKSGNCRGWEDETNVSVEVAVNRLENSDEFQERLNKEHSAHVVRHRMNNEGIIKRHEVTRKSLEKQLASLLEAERRFLNEPDQVLRDSALAKLSEAERQALGL